MTLTNRILLAMVGGILFGSIIELSMSWLDSQSRLYVIIQDGLVLGVFDVVGQRRLEGGGEGEERGGKTRECTARH